MNRIISRFPDETLKTGSAYRPQFNKIKYLNSQTSLNSLSAKLKADLQQS